MKSFFDHYIDLATLGCGILLSLVAAFTTWRQSGRRTRLGILPFLFFAPVLITACMFAHLFEITYHAIENRFTGHWTYSFFLYALYLMPSVIMYLSITYFKQTRAFCLKPNAKRNMLFKTAATIALISLPAVKFTPIAALPSILSAISLIASFAARKRTKQQTAPEHHSTWTLTTP